MNGTTDPGQKMRRKWVAHWLDEDAKGGARPLFVRQWGRRQHGRKSKAAK